MTRKHIPLKTKLAAMILAWDRDRFAVTTVSHEQSKELTADQIISRVQFDHYPVRHADGGPDAPWNLTPRLVADHRRKSKLDAKDMAKERKVRRAVEAHKQRQLLKSKGRKPVKQSRWPSRPFPRRARQWSSM